MKILQTLKTKTTRTMTLVVVLCATILAAVPVPAHGGRRDCGANQRDGAFSDQLR
jgi:hypothetical protein